MDIDSNTLVLGYLRAQNFNRTAKELEIESRHARRVKDVLSSINGREELMPQLPSILSEYCAIKKAEKDLLANGPSSTIQTLWRQLDALIHQLKFVSMGRQNNVNTTQFSRGSNATRNSYYERVLASVSTSRPAPQSTVTQSGNAPTAQQRVNQQPIGPSTASQPKQPDQSLNSQRTSEDFNPTSPSRRQTHDREAFEEHLSKSPKRKRIRPKKIISNEQKSAKAITSPISPDRNGQFGEQRSTESANQMQSSSEELNMIFDTLLNSKNLQEKIADNINKVATCTNLSTCDARDTESLEAATAHSTINVEEVLNMTRSDPSFESLFAALDDFETSPSTLPTPHKSFEYSISPMLPLATEFDPLGDGALISEIATNEGRAGSAACNLSSGEAGTPPSGQTDQGIVNLLEVNSAASSSREQLVNPLQGIDVGITNNRDAGRNSNPSTSVLPLNSVCSVYIKKDSPGDITRNVATVKSRKQTTRKNGRARRKVGTNAVDTAQNVVLTATGSLEAKENPSKNSCTDEFLPNACRRQLVCAPFLSNEEPKSKDDKRRKKEKRNSGTRSKAKEQGSNLKRDADLQVFNNNESIVHGTVTGRGDEDGICRLGDSEPGTDFSQQEAAGDPILHGNDENYDDKGSFRSAYSVSFGTNPSENEERETDASIASDGSREAPPDEIACGGSLVDEDSCDRDTRDTNIHDNAIGCSNHSLDSTQKRRIREDTVARRNRARRNLSLTDMSPEFDMGIQGHRRNTFKDKNVDAQEEMTEFDDRVKSHANFDTQDMDPASSPKDCGPSPGSCNIFEQFEKQKLPRKGRTVRFDLTEKAGCGVKNKAENRLPDNGDEKGGPESRSESASKCDSRSNVGNLCGKKPLKSILKKISASKSASLQKDINLVLEKRMTGISSISRETEDRVEGRREADVKEVDVIARDSAASKMNVCVVKQNLNKLNILVSRDVDCTANGDRDGDFDEHRKMKETVECYTSALDDNTTKYKGSEKQALNSRCETDTDKNPQTASEIDPFPGYLEIITSPKNNRLEYTVKDLESALKGAGKEQDTDGLVKYLSPRKLKTKAEDPVKRWSSPRRKKVAEVADIEKSFFFGDRSAVSSPEESEGRVLRTSPRRRKDLGDVNEEANGKTKKGTQDFGLGNCKQGLREVSPTKENVRGKGSKDETKRSSKLRGGKDGGRDGDAPEEQNEERTPRKSSQQKKNIKDKSVNKRSNRGRKDSLIRTDESVQENFSEGTHRGNGNQDMGLGLKHDKEKCVSALVDPGEPMRVSSRKKSAHETFESAGGNLDEQSKEDIGIFYGLQPDEILQKTKAGQIGRKSFAKRQSSPRKVKKTVVKCERNDEVAESDDISQGVNNDMLPQGVKESLDHIQFSLDDSAGDTQGLQSRTASGTQGAQNNTVSGTQGAQKNTSNAAQGTENKNVTQGVQNNTVSGTHGAQNNTVIGTQGAQNNTVSGTQGAQNDTVIGTQDAQDKTANATQGAQNKNVTQAVQNNTVIGTHSAPSDTEGSLRIVGANEDYICIEVVEEEKFDGILAMSQPVHGVDDSQIYIILESFETDANKAEGSLKIEGGLEDSTAGTLGSVELEQNIGRVVDERIVKDNGSAQLEIPSNHSGLIIPPSDTSTKQDVDYSLSNLDYRNPLSNEEAESKIAIKNESSLTDNVTQISNYSRSELDYRNPLSRVISEETGLKKSITNQTSLTDNVTQISDYSRSDLDYRNPLSRVISEETGLKKSIIDQIRVTDNVTEVTDYSRLDSDYRNPESTSSKETESTRSSANESCDLSGVNRDIGSAIHRRSDLVNVLGATDDNATQGYSPIKRGLIDRSDHDRQSLGNHPNDSTDGLGFKILSRDVTSDVSDSSNIESNFLEMYGSKKDNFVIYLSDDSNDSSRDQVITKDKKGKTDVEDKSDDVIKGDRAINDKVNSKLDSLNEQANLEDNTQKNKDKCDLMIDGNQSISDRFDVSNQTNASHHIRNNDIITSVHGRNDRVLISDQTDDLIKDDQARTDMAMNPDFIHDSTRPLVSTAKRKEASQTASEKTANENSKNRSVMKVASTKSVSEKSCPMPSQLFVENESEYHDKQSFSSNVSIEGVLLNRQNECSSEQASRLDIEQEAKTKQKKLYKGSRSRKRKSGGIYSVESSEPRKKRQKESDATASTLEIPQDLDIEGFLSNLDYSS